MGTSGPVGLNSRVVVTSTWLGVVTNRLAKSLTGETLQHSEINRLQFQIRKYSISNTARFSSPAKFCDMYRCIKVKNTLLWIWVSHKPRRHVF